MRYDYGYMEEGKLGRPYNMKLLQRLCRYALPYKKIVLVTLTLALTITVFELSIPYLSKIAIDRYILSSWYLVTFPDPSLVEEKIFPDAYDQLIEWNDARTHGLLYHNNLKQIEPADLHLFRSKGIISHQRFYKTSIDLQAGDAGNQPDSGQVVLSEKTVAIPVEQLSSMSPRDILRMRDKDFRGLHLLGLILLGLILCSFGLNYWEYYLLEFMGQNIMRDIRLALFQRIQSRAVNFFDRHPVGSLVTRVTNDIENLNEMFKSVIVTVFKDIFILAGILTVLIYMNWRLAIVSFIIIPVIFGLTLLFSSLAREVFRELRATIAKINAFLQERFSNMHVIQLFAREEYQMNQFKTINHENFLAGMKQIRLFAIFMPVMELLSSCAVALILWHGGGKVISEQISLGSLVAFIHYIQMFFKPIRDISEKYNIMQLAMASTERIFEFMDHGETIPEVENPYHPDGVRGHLRFENVSFGYNGDRRILHDISFEIQPGEMVAIVGPTGAGKTTIVNLLERFHDPDEGVISLDGIDIRQWSLPALRARIGLVMQDVFIFSGNLMNNISLERNEIPKDSIEQAVRDVNAQQFIQKLPHGFQQELGEGGSTLSGGERQLLSFARALAARPDLLILDEATSSVDPETERLIQDAIATMTQRQTTLVIAHRLSTIQKADRILVIHNGRICEQGSHEELLTLGGLYYKLNKFWELKGNRGSL